MSSRTATIKAVVLGDADDFKRSMSEVGESAEEAGTKVKRDLGESFDKLGEGAGGAEQKFIGLADTIGGTQDVMEGLRTGNVQTLATGLADLAGATEALWSSFGKVITQTWAKITATGADTAATATNTTATIGQRIATAAATVAAKAQAAAQWALNAAMNANPIMLIVVALAALVAGFVIAYKNVGWFRDAVDAVGRFFADTLWPILKSVGEWLGTVFVALWGAATSAVGWLWDKLQALWSIITNDVWPVLQTVAGWIGDYFVVQWQVATTAIGFVVDALRWLWDMAAHYVWPVLQTVAGWIGTYFVTQFQVARTAIGWVIDRFQDALTKAQEVKDGIVTAFDTVVGFISGLSGRITSAASGMWDGIKDAFRSAINWVISGWNNLAFSFPSFDTKIPGVGRVGGFSVGTPDIPYLAKGGLIKGGQGGTLAFLGEGRADELVVPLDRAVPSGIGRNIYVTVQAGPATNVRRLGRDLRAILNEYDRASP